MGFACPPGARRRVFQAVASFFKLSIYVCLAIGLRVYQRKLDHGLLELTEAGSLAEEKVLGLQGCQRNIY